MYISILFTLPINSKSQLVAEVFVAVQDTIDINNHTTSKHNS